MVSVMETYVSTLFEHLQRPVPKGYAAVSLGQILSADKELFVRAAHNLDGRLQNPAVQVLQDRITVGVAVLDAHASTSSTSAPREKAVQRN